MTVNVKASEVSISIVGGENVKCTLDDKSVVQRTVAKNVQCFVLDDASNLIRSIVFTAGREFNRGFVNEVLFYIANNVYATAKLDAKREKWHVSYKTVDSDAPNAKLTKSFECERSASKQSSDKTKIDLGPDLIMLLGRVLTATRVHVERESAIKLAKREASEAKDQLATLREVLAKQGIDVEALLKAKQA